MKQASRPDMVSALSFHLKNNVAPNGVRNASGMVCNVVLAPDCTFHVKTKVAPICVRSAADMVCDVVLAPQPIPILPPAPIRC